MDSSVQEDELYSFLKKKYKSLESCKIIYDSYNNISKGFGFADFNDIKDYKKKKKKYENMKFKENQLIIK